MRLCGIKRFLDGRKLLRDKQCSGRCRQGGTRNKAERSKSIKRGRTPVKKGSRKCSYRYLCAFLRGVFSERQGPKENYPSPISQESRKEAAHAFSGTRLGSDAALMGDGEAAEAGAAVLASIRATRVSGIAGIILGNDGLSLHPGRQ